MTGHWADALVELDACNAAVEWARTQPSYAQAWRRCPRGDWLLWLAGRLCEPGSDEHRDVVMAGCACARTALRYVADGEERPLRAIQMAEDWALGGEATRADLQSAAADAAAADAAHAAYAAAYAAAHKRMATIVRRYVTRPRLGDR